MPKGATVIALGENVSGTLSDEGILTLTLDTTKALRRSRIKVDKDGKQRGGQNVTVATTSGNKPVPGLEGFKLGLTFYRPALEGE